MQTNTAKSVIETAKKNGVKMVDLKFTDMFGAWQHFSIPLRELVPATFEEGLGIDGSSIRGWKSIEASDMLVVPDAKTAFMDPFCAVPTLSLTCCVLEAGTCELYKRDPRVIAHRAEDFLQGSGFADTAYFGAEAEFFILDEVRYENKNHGCMYMIDSAEGIWNSAREEYPNLGYKTRYKEGYFPVAPSDSLQDLRTEMVMILEELGLEVERQHREVATGGQSEIDFRFDTLQKAADKMMIFKYVIKNTARRHGKTATFMPKPMFGDNGSGMHIHQSLWRNGKPLFSGSEYAGLSQMALHYMGGILKHARALCAICSPCTNSYHRLVPGYEAPVNLAYSASNRSAAIRIPNFSSSPKARRIEYRPPDPSANPYLAFSALLMAGLDGVMNKIDPGEPMDKNIYELPPEELKNLPCVPSNLGDALDCLEMDHEFLLKGDVFTRDFLEAYVSIKRKEENALRLRPHPIEYEMYYDV